ncbi:unnamed protein product [Parascedosporium putredinis]|uniref:CBM-cenC domain-containing protein n=1 Tax=Parascedosporium putredinis TaxID=1442378 RepID=A0A9P1M8L6_9PEZI|nr:unnamed protein product [Parascedosporium putredinis]CAI7990341.1 unnamed protein product [Parascedosporium putredinis]
MYRHSLLGGTPVCTNLVDNYSFEEEGTGWTIATGTIKAGDLSIPAQHEDSYVELKLYRWATSLPATSTAAEAVCTNRILNPSFENGVGGKDHWTVPSGAWVQGIDGAQTPYDGNGYMFVTLPSGWTAAFTQTLSNVEIGETYLLDLQYALGTFQNFLINKCTFTIYLDGIQQGATITPTPGPVSQWTSVVRSITVTNSAPVLSVSSSCNGGQVNFMFDGFSLVEEACL